MSFPVKYHDPEVMEFKRDYARWLRLRGKSPDTCRSYSMRAVAWLESEMSVSEWWEGSPSNHELKLRKAAIKLLAEFPDYTLPRELELPEPPPDPEGEHRDILNQFTLWLRSRGKGNVTIQSYRSMARQVLDFSLPDFDQWLADAETQGIRNRRIQALRMLQRFFVRYYPAPPWTQLDVPPKRYVERTPPSYMDRSEAYRFCEIARQRFSQREYAALMMIYGCGLRMGELVRLKMQDVVLNETPHVRILRSKHGRSRLVPLPSQSQAALERYMDGERLEQVSPHSDDRIFLSARGCYYPPDKLRAALRGIFDEWGMRPHMVVHTWRFYFATHLAEQMRANHGAVDWHALRTLLGHKNLETSQRYVGEIQTDYLGQIIQGAHPMSRWKELAEERRNRGLSIVA